MSDGGDRDQETLTRASEHDDSSTQSPPPQSPVSAADEVQPSVDDNAESISPRLHVSAEDIASTFASMYVDVKNRDPEALSVFGDQSGSSSSPYSGYTELESVGMTQLVSLEHFSDASGEMEALHVSMVLFERRPHMEFDMYSLHTFELRPQKAAYSYYVHRETCDVLTLTERGSAPLTASELTRLQLRVFPCPPLSRSAPEEGVVTADEIGATFAQMYLDVQNRCPDQLHRFWKNERNTAEGVNAYTEREMVGSAELVHTTAFFDCIRRREAPALIVFMFACETCPDTNARRLVRRRFVLDPFEVGPDNYGYYVVEECDLDAA